MKTFKELRKANGEFKQHLAFGTYLSVKLENHEKRVNDLSKELKKLEISYQKEPSQSIEKRFSEIQNEITEINAEIEQDLERFQKTEQFFKRKR